MDVRQVREFIVIGTIMCAIGAAITGTGMLLFFSLSANFL